MCTEEEEKLPGFSFFSQTQTQMKLAFVFLFVRSFVVITHSLTKAYTCKGTPPQTRSEPFKSFAQFVIHGKENKNAKKKEKKHETRAHTHTHTKAQKQKPPPPPPPPRSRVRESCRIHGTTTKINKHQNTKHTANINQNTTHKTQSKHKQTTAIHTLVEFPPRNASLSTSMTRPPFSKTVCAALRPARPPPMTMTCLDIIVIHAEDCRDSTKQR